jgi:hypothetical protein
MMKALMVIVSVMLLYLGYVFWENLVEPNMEPAARTTAAVATPALPPLETPAPAPIWQAPPGATPMPASVAAPARVAIASPTPYRNLAPEGTYFLIERISVMTDSGVVGVPPGTIVKLVSAGPAMRVSDGKNEFEVRSTQLTNDYDVALLAANADRNAQSSAGALSAREAKEFNQQQMDAQAAWDEKQRALGSVYPEPLPMTTGELNQGPKPVSQINGGGSFRSAVH